MDQDYLNDPEFQELIRQYVQFLTNSVEEVNNNLAAHDFLKVQKFGHNLKGSGGGYGLHEMSRIGQQIEESAKDYNYEALKNLIVKYQIELKKAQEKYLNQ